jgi:hypothetical protein
VESRNVFRDGLLDNEDWRARWIGTPLMGGKRTRAGSRRAPPRSTCRSRLKARDSITALGTYDAEINGVRAHDVELAPAGPTSTSASAIRRSTSLGC